MKPRASILRIRPAKYETVELELDDPQTTEVPAKTVATDLCPSDDHVATGSIPVPVFPFCGGHQGAGSSPIDRFRDPGVRLRNEELCLKVNNES
jgi:Zn-dependent alcohol dehydrogenase